MFETGFNPAIGGLDLFVPIADEAPPQGQGLEEAGASDLGPNGDLFGPDISNANALASAVYLSLFSDRRAEPGDPLPPGIMDLRGWPGDDQVGARDDSPSPLGSKIWCWSWRPLTDETAEGIRLAAQDALAWMVEDGIAGQVTVQVTIGRWSQKTRLNLQVVIRAPEGAEIYNRKHVWMWHERAKTDGDAQRRAMA